MALAYNLTSTSLSVLVNFRPQIIPSSHPNFQKLSQLVRDPNTTENDVRPLLDIPSAIAAFTGDEIKVLNGKLFYRGVEVKTNLANVILGFVKSGDPSAAVPFQKFLANCRNNPDLALVDTIYDWCVKSNLPITPDGELIAWKIVGRDYKSLTSGKRGYLDHSIGAVVTEPREECDPNRTQTCSTGIHFCSLEYLEKGCYGGGLTGNNRIVAVVVNPADITAIPTDYNLSKGRCCKLTVVGEVENKLSTRDFYGSARVYAGWEKPAPVAAPKTRFPVQIGDVWKTRDGQTVTIGGSASGIDIRSVQLGGRKLTHVFSDSGKCNRMEQRSLDLVELITPSTGKTTTGTPVFERDQRWKRRDGSIVRLKTVNATVSGYPIRDTSDRLYTAKGRFNDDKTTSQFDLVSLA